MKEYMNEQEVIEYLGIDEKTFKNFFPPPPSFKLGDYEKYKKSEIDEWIEELKIEQVEAKKVAANVELERAKIMLREKNYNEALNLVKQSLLLNSKDANAYFIYGYVLAKLEKWAESEIILRKALKLDPKADWRDEAKYQIMLCQKAQGTYFEND